MSDSIGTTLRKARMARKLTIEDVTRATKIQASRIADLEQDDYSNFPSMVYAKGFLSLYAKYLELDISEYLREFAHGGGLGMEGYDYLSGETYGQDVAKRKPSSPLPALALLTTGFIGAVLLVGIIWFINSSLKRLDSPEPTETTEVVETETIADPEPLSRTEVEQTLEEPAPVATTVEEPPVTEIDNIPVARAVPFDSSAPETPADTPAEPEPTVRRAVPVGVATAITTPTPKYEIEIRPLTRTWVRVITDKVETPPAFEGWLSTEDPPLLLQGTTFSVILLDMGAVEILKNGQKISYESTAFTIE